MFPHTSYREAIVPFEEGDILILYSDGVVEAPRTGGEEQFGEGRLEGVVRRASPTGLPHVIERVMEELRAWSGERGFDDDVTLVLARRSGLSRNDSGNIVL